MTKGTERIVLEGKSLQGDLSVSHLKLATEKQRNIAYHINSARSRAGELLLLDTFGLLQKGNILFPMTARINHSIVCVLCVFVVIVEVIGQPLLFFINIYLNLLMLNCKYKCLELLISFQFMS